MNQAGPLVPRPEPLTVGQSLNEADPMQAIRRLWHYQQGFDYQPDLYDYSDFATTDPAYVVSDVRFMSPSTFHVAQLGLWERGVDRLVGATGWHVSREVAIRNIPAACFGEDRNNGSLNPDLAVWDFPRPAGVLTSYDYEEHGTPVLVMEVVSHADRDIRERDTVAKPRYYANMGISEYWVLDRKAEPALRAYTLTSSEGFTLGQRYQPVARVAEGLPSRTLGVHLQWRDNALLYRTGSGGTWSLLAHTDMRDEDTARELRVVSPLLREILGDSDPTAVEYILSLWAADPPVKWPTFKDWLRLREAPQQWREILLSADTSGEGLP